jgi:hypothetical protein
MGTAVLFQASFHAIEFWSNLSVMVVVEISWKAMTVLGM